MATSEVDTLPVQDLKTQETELPADEVIPEQEQAATEKSTVYNDPNPTDQSGRFNKRDTVHMSLLEQGTRRKGIFTVAKGRLHSSGAYYEYQLVDANGRAYKNGEWIREKQLRMEKAR